MRPVLCPNRFNGFQPAFSALRAAVGQRAAFMPLHGTMLAQMEELDAQADDGR
jgi:hypothetical protein